MSKKVSSALILASFLVSSTFASDFLAKLSNGALSHKWNRPDELYAIAKYTQRKLQYMANYLQGNTTAPQGGIDQRSWSNPSKLIAFLQVRQNSLSSCIYSEKTGKSFKVSKIMELGHMKLSKCINFILALCKIIMKF